MRATTPVLPSHVHDYPEVILAKDQPQYNPLPVVYVDYSGGIRAAISHYKLTLGERIKLMLHGDLWLEQYVFDQRLQPQRPIVNEPLTAEDK